jgi:hypothetical protein
MDSMAEIIERPTFFSGKPNEIVLCDKFEDRKCI